MNYKLVIFVIYNNFTHQISYLMRNKSARQDKIEQLEEEIERKRKLLNELLEDTEQADNQPIIPKSDSRNLTKLKDLLKDREVIFNLFLVAGVACLSIGFIVSLIGYCLTFNKYFLFVLCFLIAVFGMGFIGNMKIVTRFFKIILER